MDTKQASLVTRRALIPEVLFAADVAIALDLPQETVEHFLPTGAFGRVVYIARRPAITRENFLEMLAARSLAQDDGAKEVLRASR